MTKVEQDREPGGEPPTDLAAERLRAKLRAKMFQVRDSGARVGRFTIIEKLGAGGMGEVFSAQEDGTERRVAIKVLHSAVADNHDDGDGGAARLLREAKALARVDHPNVVGLFDAGTDNGRVYLAMELVDGPNIEAWAKGSSVEWGDVVAKFAQAARGLGAAHAAGLVHRDVKPANLLVDADGCVKVLDFGLARRLDVEGLAIDESQWSQTLTRPGDLMGTPGYMSPEHASSGVITARSDQFGLCVALYEALFGMRPHAGETIPQLLQAIANGDRRRPPRSPVPSQVRDAIERGLQTDPERRFPSMEALADALLAPPRRVGWRVAAVTAAASVTAVGALLWWMRLPSDGDVTPETAVPQTRLQSSTDATLGHGATVRSWRRVEAELEAADPGDLDNQLRKRLAVAQAALSLGRFTRAREVLLPLMEEEGIAPSTSISVLTAMVWVVGATEHDPEAVQDAVDQTGAQSPGGEDMAPLELARGEALLRCDQPVDAADAFAAASRLWSATLPPQDARVAWARALSSATEAHARRAPPSVGVLREALAILRPSLGNEHPRVGRAQVWLAEALAYRGDVAAARGMFAEATTALRGLGEDSPQWWADAAASAATFELAQGDPDAARAQVDAVLQSEAARDAQFERWRLYRLRGEAEHALGDDEAAARSLGRAEAELAPFVTVLGTEALLLALDQARLEGASRDPATLRNRLFASRSSAAPHARVAVAAAIAAHVAEADQPRAAIRVLRTEIMFLGEGAASASSRAQLLLELATVYDGMSAPAARASALHEAQALLRRHPASVPGRAALVAKVDGELRRGAETRDHNP